MAVSQHYFVHILPAYRRILVHFGRFSGEQLSGVLRTDRRLTVLFSAEFVLLEDRFSCDRRPLAVGLNLGDNTEGFLLVSAPVSCPGVKVCEPKSILRAMVFSNARGE